MVGVEVVIKLMAVGMVVVAMVVVVVVAVIRCGGCGEYQCSATPTVYRISISVRERASPNSPNDQGPAQGAIPFHGSDR